MKVQQRRLVAIKRLRIGKLNRGQSLIEMALSITFLVLMFSGAVDLGRAFFTQVALNNAIGEAAHYISIFPNCAKRSEMNTLTNTGSNPYCEGTNSVLSRLLNESDNLDSTRISTVYITVKSPHASDDPPVTNTPPADPDEYVLTVTYRLPLITPFMRAMFGSELTLTATNDQVARTSLTPVATGIAITGTQVIPTGSTCALTGGNLPLQFTLSPAVSPNFQGAANGFAVLKDDGSGTILDTIFVSSFSSPTSWTTTVGTFTAGYYYVIPVTGTNASGKVGTPVQLANSYRSSDWYCS